MLNKFEQNYKGLLLYTLNQGDLRPNRTGVNTYGTFGCELRHNLIEGFPIITGRKIFQKNFIHELIWFLSGNTNIKYLQDNNVHIWDEWADQKGDLGPVYGHQLRHFGDSDTDQLKNLIYNLQNDKFGRRHIITLWHPGFLNKMKLPPCYYSFEFYVDSKDNLSIKVNMRSCDLFIGLPYDFSMFACLLMVIASEVKLKASEVIFSMGDTHIYENHIENVLKYNKCEIFDLPKMTYVGQLDSIKGSDFTLINYKCGEHIKSKVAV